MDAVTEYWKAWREWEDTFDGHLWIEWTRDHAELPIFAVSAYLGVVFYVPELMQKRPAFKLKLAFSCWNLFLALFSIVGSTRTAPWLLRHLQTHGYDWTICTDPADWYMHGPAALWVGMFIFSKIPELLDTIFLVLQKKRVIFLGWFHHTTVLLYCWHAYHNRIGPGLWFATMNFIVHSVMYSYYFMMAIRMRSLAKLFAPIITMMQILQMAVGAAVTTRAAMLHWQGGEELCHTDPANYKLGLGMYCSYFVLFVVLFWQKYFGGAGKRADGESSRRGGANADSTLCGVELKTNDGAGFFHANNAKKPPLRRSTRGQVVSSDCDSADDPPVNKKSN